MSRAQSCDRKAKFGPDKAFKKADQWGQRAYLCKVCGYYHLTSKPNRNLDGQARKLEL